jgi:hypothetical protein
MIMNATHLHGQDDQPRKKSLMAPIVQGLICGGIVCGVLTALVTVLRYGTQGHPFIHDVRMAHDHRLAPSARLSMACRVASRAIDWAGVRTVAGMRSDRERGKRRGGVFIL